MSNHEKETMEIVGKKINELCQIHGLTKEQFSEKCGIPMEKMEQYLSCEIEMPLDEYIKILNSFNVSSDYMLGFSPYPFPMPKTQEEAALYRQLASMDKKQLMELRNRLLKELENAE